MIEKTIAVCAAMFIVVLGVSAYWDPTIHVLHVLEALPYLLAAAHPSQKQIQLRLGFAAGAFWLVGLRTSFIRNGSSG